MKQYIIYIASVSILLISCSGDKTQTSWSQARISRYLDSIDISRLVAGYCIENGYSLIISDSNGRGRKFDCNDGFPIIVNHLKVVGQNRYRSEKLRTTFLIYEQSVVSVLEQKIIHPSSNWQGQTPWKERIVWSNQRLDLNR